MVVTMSYNVLRDTILRKLALMPYGNVKRDVGIFHLNVKVSLPNYKTI